MRVKQVVMALVAIAMLAAVGCNSTQSVDKNPVIKTDKGKDYASISNTDLFKEGGSGTLTITNKASFDVIIFAGRLENNTVMGGIKSQKQRIFDLTTLGLPGRIWKFSYSCRIL